jgi:hypothetical protein
MIRLRRFAAPARQVRLRRFHLRASRYGGHVAAPARQALTTAAAVIVGGGSSVLACPLCFGAQETSMVDGTRLGILVMVAITLVVQGGFVGFFLYLRRRAKRNAEIELDTEWSELQGSSRTSP